MTTPRVETLALPLTQSNRTTLSRPIDNTLELRRYTSLRSSNGAYFEEAVFEVEKSSKARWMIDVPSLVRNCLSSKNWVLAGSTSPVLCFQAIWLLSEELLALGETLRDLVRREILTATRALLARFNIGRRG